MTSLKAVIPARRREGVNMLVNIILNGLDLFNYVIYQYSTQIGFLQQEHLFKTVYDYYM